MASRQIGEDVVLDTGDRIRGVELSGEDHPGYDPFTLDVSSVFIQFIDRNGSLVRMARCADVSVVLHKMQEYSVAAGKE